MGVSSPNSCMPVRGAWIVASNRSAASNESRMWWRQVRRMQSTSSTSSGTASGSSSTLSSGIQYELTSMPMFGCGAVQCQIPGAISLMGSFCNKSCSLQEKRNCC